MENRTAKIFNRKMGVPNHVIEEVFRLGIWPSFHKMPVGMQDEVNGQPFTCIGHTTAEDFIKKFEEMFNYTPNALEGLFFNLISTD